MAVSNLSNNRFNVCPFNGSLPGAWERSPQSPEAHGGVGAKPPDYWDPENGFSPPPQELPKVSLKCNVVDGCIQTKEAVRVTMVFC